MNVKSTASTKNLAKLFKSQIGADIHFLLKCEQNSLQLKVPAHKAIMAVSSPVCGRMFLEEVNEVTIEDVSFEGFCEFLQFFYLDEIELSERNLIEVLNLVDKFDMQECYTTLPTLLKQTVTSANVCLYYELASTLNFLPGELILYFEGRIRNDTTIVLDSTSFEKCSKMVLKRILKMDSLNCSDFNIFNASIKWASAECRRHNLPASPENLKTALDGCLSLIRFPSMSAEEYSFCMEKYPGLLVYNFFFDILNYIVSKRPLTCARHFSTSTRQPINVPVPLGVTENDTGEDQIHPLLHSRLGGKECFKIS